MFQFASAGQIHFGLGSSKQLPELVRGLGTRAFLVLGRSQRNRDRFEALLHEAGVTVQVGRISGEPTVMDALTLVAAARDAGADFVVGVGGGSVLDGAKAIAALLANPGDPFDFLEVVGRGKALGRPSLPLVAVPTTAGTGSEVTKNAVLGATEHGVKVSLRNDWMLPRVALIDPELCLDLPPALTAQTGLDALTQVLEPFVSSRANPLTDALSREALTRARSALRRAFHDGKDRAARSDMCLVSLFGGLCLANAKLGAVHGFAGPIGGLFPAPHGAVCARLLPGVVRQNLAALRARAPADPALAKYAEAARILIGRSDAQADDLADWLTELVEELGIARLRHYGLSSSDTARLVAKARVSSSMAGNPIVLTPEELAETLESAI